MTAHLFQEWIDKAFEARVVVAGQKVFAVAIHVDSAAGRVDWRSDYDSHRYEVIEPPEPVRSGLLSLHERLGPVYGASDFVITPEGDWVFLEVNQGGEWGWLAEGCGLPLASAVADLLEKGAV